MRVDWASVKMNLGNAWSNRITGDRKENIDESIQYYNESLEVIPREAMSAKWATAKVNINHGSNGEAC